MEVPTALLEKLQWETVRVCVGKEKERGGIRGQPVRFS